MRVIEAHVRAGKTTTNPHESYSNVRADVELRAAVDPDENTDGIVVALQQTALEMVDEQLATALARSRQQQIDLRSTPCYPRDACARCRHDRDVHTAEGCQVTACSCAGFMESLGRTQEAEQADGNAPF